jgi:uncharacterized protein involved in exopolysaccharide biosynthesis
MSVASPRNPALSPAMIGPRPLEPEDDFPSFGQILTRVWGRRWLVLAAAAVLGGLALIASLVIHKKYDAAVVIAAVSEDSGGGGLGGLSSLVSQIGGIASVAGLSVSRNEHKAESLAILQSEALTERFISENNLLPVLYPKLWDPVRRQWKTTDPEEMPTLWKANQYFKRIRHVSTDVKTDLTTVTVTWRDPRIAAAWANDLVAMSNDVIRVRTIREAERNITYLNEQLAKSTIVAVQNSISSLLESEIKKVMLAKGSQEYAFKVIDPAVPPERPSFPSPTLWTVLGVFAGVLLASLFILTQSGMSASQPRPESDSTAEPR